MVENLENHQKGRIFIISGPSGVGKGTSLSLLLREHPEIVLSTSLTTRNPRKGEKEGVDYFFTTKEHFEEMIKEGKLLEWAEFAGNYYGTCIDVVNNIISQGKDIILEIDVQGALQVKEKIKDITLIFIMPPSFDELESRLYNRNTDTKENIEKRLAIFRDEIEKKKDFDYEIVNKDLDETVKKLEEIIIKERDKNKDRK